jgi:hypothetical protein
MNVVDIISIVAAFAVVGWFVRILLDRDRDAERFEEDDARTYFDEHGHWPDETPADAEARARRGARNERLARAEDRDV